MANKISFPFEVTFHLEASHFAIAKLKRERLIAKTRPYNTNIIIDKVVKKPVKRRKRAK